MSQLLILPQNIEYAADTVFTVVSILISLKLNNSFKEILNLLQRAVTLAQEKGASSWLTALPMQKHGFSLQKTTFRDAPF